MLFNAADGPVNALLEMAGIAPSNGPSRCPWALVTIVTALVWQWTPFVAVILLGGLTTIPPVGPRSRPPRRRRPVAHAPPHHAPLPPAVLPRRRAPHDHRNRPALRSPLLPDPGRPRNETVLSGIYLFKLAFNFRNFGGASAMALLFVVVLSAIATLYVRLGFRKGRTA
jgi:multiple sugar transport system permease protein